MSAAEHERVWEFELECGHKQLVHTFIGDFDIAGLHEGMPVVCVECSSLEEPFHQVLRMWTAEWIAGAIEDAKVQSPGETPRFVTTIVGYVEQDKHVYGPMSLASVALDERGRALGNYYVFLAGRPGEDASWIFASNAVAMQTIAFMHCRNVKVERHKPDEKMSRARMKRAGKPLVEYRTVRLEVPRTSYTNPEKGSPHASPATHIVPGHFSHYGNCCPGAHEPNGKLFGKLEGVYWMPQHLRGAGGDGPRRDYEVVVNQPGPDAVT